MFKSVSYDKVKSLSGVKKFGGRQLVIPEPNQEDLKFVDEIQDRMKRSHFDREDIFFTMRRALREQSYFGVIWMLSFKWKKEPYFQNNNNDFQRMFSYFLGERGASDFDLDVLNYLKLAYPDMLQEDPSRWSGCFGHDDRIDDFLMRNISYDEGHLRSVVQKGKPDTFKKLYQYYDIDKWRLETCVWRDTVQENQLEIAKFLAAQVDEGENGFWYYNDLYHDIMRGQVDLSFVDFLIADGAACVNELFIKACLYERIDYVRHCAENYDLDLETVGVKALHFAIDERHAELFDYLLDLGVPTEGILESVLKPDSEDTKAFLTSLKKAFVPVAGKIAGTSWALDNENAVTKTIRGTQTQRYVLYDFAERQVVTTIKWYNSDIPPTSIMVDFRNYTNPSDLQKAEEQFKALGGDETILFTFPQKNAQQVLSPATVAKLKRNS